MGGWVVGEEASVDNSVAEQFETCFTWTPVLGDGDCRLFGDIQELADVR